jgi:hypothetical protein
MLETGRCSFMLELFVVQQDAIHSNEKICLHLESPMAIQWMPRTAELTTSFNWITKYNDEYYL